MVIKIKFVRLSQVLLIVLVLFYSDDTQIFQNIQIHTGDKRPYRKQKYKVLSSYADSMKQRLHKNQNVRFYWVYYFLVSCCVATLIPMTQSLPFSFQNTCLHAQLIQKTYKNKNQGFIMFANRSYKGHINIEMPGSLEFC